MGEPPAAPFAPAPFQRTALEALEHGDVLVSAPTGSGKTWIAEQEIARLLGRPQHDAGDAQAASGARSASLARVDGGHAPVVAQGRRIWYTAPLKALSNQKFRRFQLLYGEPAVGLLTGERRVNSNAHVIVATTEILRNVLYEAPGREAPEVLVLDEAHYLADQERGTAWEEVILLAPPFTRLLLLSATVPNAHDLAAWMGTVRGHRPQVITLDERPVPLAFLFADASGHLLPPELRRVRGRRRHPRWLPTVADALVENYLTPAIIFFPSRRECDEAARLLGARPAPGEPERAERIRSWIARTPQLSGHPLLPALRRGGVAPHHAGHLTAWRMCVEEMLEAGLVRMVCATTTLAAGLDVPARTVLLSTLYRHGPAGPEPLTPTEFHQMTGRAGRRGRDTLGIAIIGVETREDAEEGLALSAASPDPVTSAFTPSDTQVLNLLARMPVRDAEALLRRSFAVYLRAAELAEARARLASLPEDPLAERPCTDRLSTRRRFDRLLEQLRRARRRKDETAGAEVAHLGEEALRMPCTGCRVVAQCLESLPDLARLERERRALARQIAEREDLEVAHFRSRARILRDLGYLDGEWRLSAHGQTAARIRHPRMLVLAEALRGDIFPTTPAALAAVAGALGTERVKVPRGGLRAGHLAAAGHRSGAEARYGPNRLPAGTGGRFRSWRWDPMDLLPPGARGPLVQLKRIVTRLNALLRDAGLPEDQLEEEFAGGGAHGGPAPAVWRAAVVGAWAEEQPWGAVTAAYHIPEGDLQRLVWQAAEILAQLEDLPQHSVSTTAQAARGALLRPPVT
jgi:superfamily II RNA helicase